jgi:hypothetical protein
MSALVSTFLDISLGKGKYLFFLVAWTDYESNIKQELDKQWQPFGSHLGIDGTIIRAYDQHSNETYQETLQKQWPRDIAKRMKQEQDPFPFGYRPIV